MSDFAARCTDCGFTWNTPAMAEGLRVLGACPKCKGALEFGSRGAAPGDVRAERRSAVAPHLVLGLPRV